MPQEDAKKLATAWMSVFNASVFDEYLEYIIKATMLSREWKGPITADEFLRVMVRVKKNREIFEAKGREWISVDDAVLLIYRASIDQSALAADPNPTDDQRIAIESKIYGWN